jgi:transcriptional regulator with XRE-family HTH domain
MSADASTEPDLIISQTPDTCPIPVMQARELRDKFGLTVTEMADRTDASVRQVYRWLAGAGPRSKALRTNLDRLYRTVTGAAAAAA